MKVIVIIPAAGLGTRMAPVRSAKGKLVASKQFTELGGVPILFRTVRVFAAMQEIEEIYIALRAGEIGTFRPRLEKEGKPKKVRVIEGGEHRQESVAHALSQVTAEPDDIILVHDAVRPFVTDEIVRRVIYETERKGAAIAGVPAVDTVKQVERTAEGALIKATIPREGVVMAQTPQGFRYTILKRAFDDAQGFLATDEAALVERTGHEVHVVMGSTRNIKITTPSDMDLAEFYLKPKVEPADRR
jgi:2-C-methyl-D-erythritol 4-phosphate cytidylyltransferase